MDGQRRVPDRFTPREKDSAPIAQEAGAGPRAGLDVLKNIKLAYPRWDSDRPVRKFDTKAVKT